MCRSALRQAVPGAFALLDQHMPGNIHIHPLGEVATQSGGGVGDCGGGPLRVILGGAAPTAAIALKLLLLILPLLHALMWAVRALPSRKRPGGRKRVRIDFVCLLLNTYLTGDSLRESTVADAPATPRRAR